MTTLSAGSQLPDPSQHPYVPIPTPDDTTTTTTSTSSAAKFSSSTSAPSSSSLARTSRRSLAVIAFEKTSNAIANLASLGSAPNASSLRSSASAGSLSKHSHKYSQLGNPAPAASVDGPASGEQSPQNEEQSQTGEAPETSASKRRNTIQLVRRPGAPSPPPLPGVTALARSNSKMHQTSSRLLRMTEDDRPFTKVCPVQLYKG